MHQVSIQPCDERIACNSGISVVNMMSHLVGHVYFLSLILMCDKFCNSHFKVGTRAILSSCKECFTEPTKVILIPHHESEESDPTNSLIRTRGL